MAVVAGFEPAHPELTARTDTLPDIPQICFLKRMLTIQLVANQLFRVDAECAFLHHI